jgi:hypothetical protein
VFTEIAIAPSCAHAKKQLSQADTFGSQSATRSPGPMPRRDKPVATQRLSAAISANPTRFPRSNSIGDVSVARAASSAGNVESLRCAFNEFLQSLDAKRKYYCLFSFVRKSAHAHVVFRF